ncbi:MAG: hypothetical protein V7K68_11865 [Nostoc sp.]|uniref:hypothetical protein n=1 Tax=Nostoc sp. TaxID=1180 RepID=UPI002FF5D967
MGLFHSLKGAYLQASWAKNQVIKKSDWTIIIAMPSLPEALPTVIPAVYILKFTY